MFAKVEPGAYTEEAIAASKGADSDGGVAAVRPNGVANGGPTLNEQVGAGSGAAERGIDGNDPKVDERKKGTKACVSSAACLHLGLALRRCHIPPSVSQAC